MPERRAQSWEGSEVFERCGGREAGELSTGVSYVSTEDSSRQNAPHKTNRDYSTDNIFLLSMELHFQQKA
eukprot:5378902-Amphidinium_carterae.1